MSAQMADRFASVGLRMYTGEDALVASTYEAHRVQTAAYLSGGQAAQDKAAEIIFKGYFSEGKAPSDSATLEAACIAAGLDARQVLGDRSVSKKELEQELTHGRSIVTSGVPHFVIRGESGAPVEFSGAQPPETFLKAFARVVGR